MIAEVVVNSRAAELNRTFDYHIPDGLEVSLRDACACSVWK